MQTTARIQTAFRLDSRLVSRLKLKARRENKSLNRLVEECLMKVAPAELEWPKVKFPLKTDPVFDEIMFKTPLKFTREELDADPKLEYLINKHCHESLP